ncbi:hypothetical protein E2C01_078945 [Portunus trituberculatus]|uniref:Uncharacterized protein n=1 Tax=Portunus trituberculatus TaxID=210409 RepID=A0A5B7IRH0_PORTR|nr:hypothetical protein [Portunus trituberculatus]
MRVYGSSSLSLHALRCIWPCLSIAGLYTRHAFTVSNHRFLSHCASSALTTHILSTSPHAPPGSALRPYISTYYTPRCDPDTRPLYSLNASSTRQHPVRFPFTLLANRTSSAHPHTPAAPITRLHTARHTPFRRWVWLEANRVNHLLPNTHLDPHAKVHLDPNCPQVIKYTPGVFYLNLPTFLPHSLTHSAP